MGEDRFVRGALILAGAGAMSRLLGLVYVIVLPRVIEDTGYGLFHMVRPIHYIAVVFAVAGMPVAISKLVAEKAAQGRRDGVLRVFHVATTSLFTMGMAVGLTLLWAAEWIATTVLKDPGAFYALVALAPSVLLLSLMAAWRGFFLGLQQMGFNALSQVSEQVVRVIATLAGAMWLLPRGVEWAAGGASFGTVAGALAGLLTLMALHARRGRGLIARIPSVEPDPEPAGRLLGRLMAFAFPLMLSAVLWPVMGSIDAAIVPARLREAGLDAVAVRQAYGHLGMASQMVSLPTVLSMALAASLVPAVAEAVAVKRRGAINRKIHDSLRLAGIFALPAAVGLIVLAEPVATVVFGYSQAAIPLRILAPGAALLVWFQTSSGVLNGLGRPLWPLWSMVACIIIKTGLSYYLTVIPWLGIRGAAWGSTAGYAVAAWINLSVAHRLAGLRPAWVDFAGRPATAALGMGIGLHAVLGPTEEWMRTLISGSAEAVSSAWDGAAALALLVPLGAVLYGVALGLMGGLHVRDLAHIPHWGPRLARWAERRRIRR